MRTFLTTAGVALVLLLTLALIAPPFIDWSSLRDPLEARLSALADAKIVFDGPVSVRLLPAPRIEASQMRFERDGLKFSARETAFEIAPWDLLRGKVRFIEARLASARIEIDPAHLTVSQTNEIGLERFSVRDGVFLLKDAKPLEISGVDLDGKAESLRGPMSASGFIRGLEGSRAFTLAFGAVEAGRVGLKFELAPLEAEPALKFEGAALLKPEGLALEGMGAWERRLGQNVQAPVLRIEGRLSGDRDHAKIERLNVALGAPAGQEGARLTASGQAEFETAQGWRVGLSAQNADLDAFAEHWLLSDWTPILEQEKSVAIAAMQLQAKATRWGGQILRFIDFDYDAPAGFFNVQADAPGGAFRLRGPWPLQNKFSPQAAQNKILESKFSFFADVQDRAQLAQWLQPIAPSPARALADAPFKIFHTEGAAEAIAGGYAFENVAMRADRLDFVASGRWLEAVGQERAKLEGRIDIPLLDLADLPDLSQRAYPDSVDLDVSVTARALKYGLHQGVGSFSLALRRVDRSLALENIAFSGPQAQAQGRLALDGAGWTGDLAINAARLGELALLAQSFRPSLIGATIAARPQDFSPAKARLTLKADAAGQSATMVGEAAGARFSLAPAGAGVAALTVQSSDAAIVLRQFGFSVLPTRAAGAARLDLRWPMSAQGPFSANFSIAGLNGAYSGDGGWADKEFRTSGAFKAQSADAQQILQLFGFSAGAAFPATLEAQLSLSPAGVELDGLSAQVMGRKTTGRLTRAFGANSDGTWRGALLFDEIHAPSVLALMLGETQPARAGLLWSDLAFAPIPYDLPPLDINLSAARLTGEPTGALAPMTNFRAHLQASPGRLRIADFFAQAGQGRISGEVDFSRDKGAVGLRGNLEWSGLDVTAGPFFVSASGKLELAGSGGSAAALVGSLAGSGTTILEQGRLDQSAPDALGATIANFEQRTEPYGAGDVARDYRQRLDAGPGSFGPIESALQLAGGRLALAAGSGEANILLAFDAASGQSEIALRQRAPAPPDWEGAAPAALTIARGRGGVFVRSVDIDDLAARLLARTLQRELARPPAPVFERPEPPAAPKIPERPAPPPRPEATIAAPPRPIARPHRPAPRPAPRAPNAFAPVPYEHAPDPASVGQY